MHGAMTAKLRLAFGATLFGLAVGTVVAGILSTIRLLLVAWWGRVPSLITVLTEPLLAFPGAMVSIVIGAVLYLLAPGFVLFAAYALAAGETRLGPGRTGLHAIIFTLILFIPMFYVGYRSRPAEGLLLGAALLVGVREGLRWLDHRLSRRSPEAPRLPKPLLLTAAAALTLIALWGSVLIITWLRHPGGIGMEWIAVPIAGLTVLLCLSGAVALGRRALR